MSDETLSRDQIIAKLSPLTSPIPWQVALKHKQKAAQYRVWGDEASRAGQTKEADEFYRLADRYDKLTHNFHEKVVFVVNLMLSNPSLPFNRRLISGEYDPEDAANLVGSIVEKLRSQANKDSLGLPTEPQDDFAFVKEGAGWLICGFRESGFVEDMDGLGYIHALLRANGPVPTVALIAGEATTTAKPLDGDPVLDDEAKKKYQSKIDELEDAIKEARENNDIARVEYLQAQRHRLIKELQSAYSIDGKIRRLGAEADKLRVRVRNAIRRAYKRLAESGLKQVADHFQSHVTIGGKDSSYHPPVRPNWRLQ